MIAFTVIVGHEFGHCPAKMALTQWDRLVQAFLFERTDKPLRVRVAVRRAERRLHDSHTRRLEEVLHGDTPLPISIADQDGVCAEDSLDRVRQVTHRLDDELFIGMWR